MRLPCICAEFAGHLMRKPLSLVDAMLLEKSTGALCQLVSSVLCLGVSSKSAEDTRENEDHVSATYEPLPGGSRYRT